MDEIDNISLKIIDEKICNFKDIELLDFQIRLVTELLKSFQCFDNTFEKDHESEESILKDYEYDVFNKEFKRRKAYLIKNYDILFLNCDETKSELYCKATNAKSFIEREKPLLDEEYDEGGSNLFNINDDNICEDDENTVYRNNQINENEIFNEEQEVKKQQMDGFFSDAQSKLEDLNRRESNDRQIFMEHNEVKVLHSYAMSFWRLYFLKYHYENHKEYKQTSSKNCEFLIKYGFSKMVYNSNKSICEYTLTDVYIALQIVVEYKMYFYNVKNEVGQDIYNELLNSLNRYTKILFYRYSYITNLLEERVKYIDYGNFVKKNENCVICNLVSYMCFISFYKNLKTFLEFNKHFIEENLVKYDFTNKLNMELDVKDTKTIKKYYSTFINGFFSEYKPEILYQFENMSKKLQIPFNIMKSYFYDQWFSGKVTMKKVFNVYNDESNYQNTILRHYFPNVNEKILDFYQLFCINPGCILELDQKENENFKKYQEYLKSPDKKEPCSLEIVKTIAYNNIALIMLHLWFKVSSNYSNFLYRYVIPIQALSRYVYLLKY